MTRPILDASALLAYLYEEPGGQDVREAITDGATISVGNLAETFSRIADCGLDPEDFEARLRNVDCLAARSTSRRSRPQTRSTSESCAG